MKILCAYSGLEYQVEHIPSYLQGTGEVHPVFAIPQKKLFSLLPKWSAGELTDTDNYLLFLAFLNSTELIRWSCPVLRTPQTAALIQNNMQGLVSMVGTINAIKHPSFVLPSFVISQQTRTLDNVRYWIKIWETQYQDFLSGLKDDELRSKLSRRESALEKLIRNPGINPSKYAGTLAKWASEAGKFPLFRLKSPITGESTTCCDYWQEVIKRCYSSESILAVPKADLDELLEHCEESIEAGSIFSFHLFSTLREGRDRQRNFLGIDFSMNLSADNPGFRILDADANIEDAAIQLLIDTAPKELPNRKDYPTAFAYMRAKLKWDTAQKYLIHPVMDEPMLTPEGDI